MKTLEYPLPALNMYFDECNKLMKIVKQGLLAKARISKSRPSSALYGPIAEGGLNLHHLYITQGLKHLEKLTQYLSSSTITGKLIKVSLELSVLEIGIGRNIFQLVYNNFEMLVYCQKAG